VSCDSIPLGGLPSVLDYVCLRLLSYPLWLLEGIFYLSFCSLLLASINKIISGGLLFLHGSEREKWNIFLCSEMTDTCSYFLSSTIISKSLLPVSPIPIRLFIIFLCSIQLMSVFIWNLKHILNYMYFIVHCLVIQLLVECFSSFSKSKYSLTSQ
jgi:hypothetical protein